MLNLFPKNPRDLQLGLGLDLFPKNPRDLKAQHVEFRDALWVIQRDFDGYLEPSAGQFEGKVGIRGGKNDGDSHTILQVGLGSESSGLGFSVGVRVGLG